MKISEDQKNTYGQLVEHLQSHREALISEWAAQVRKEFSDSPEPLTDPEIIDHIPGVFDAIIQAIRQYRSDTTIEQVKQIAARHTVIRWAQHYNLHAVLREISLLRSAFIHYLSLFEDEHQQVDSNARVFTSQTIHIMLDDVVLDATDLFLNLKAKADRDEA